MIHTVRLMTRKHELERDRQVAELKAVLRSSAQQPADGEVDSRTLDGFGDGFEPPRAAWRARLVRQRGSVTVFVAVAVLAAAATALVTWFLRPAPTPVPGSVGEVVAGDEHADRSGSGTPPSSAPAEGTQNAQVIVVAVVGQVAVPGLVTLPEGSRVSDAIAAAGGALPGTDLTSINIARKVSDGEQVAVGIPAAPDVGPPEQPGSAGGAGKVNLNSASLEQLDGLPGVGPVIAQRIVDFREANGPFASVADLANVSGIGPSIMAKLTDLVVV